jgi:hypothetical protein
LLSYMKRGEILEFFYGRQGAITHFSNNVTVKILV